MTRQAISPRHPSLRRSSGRPAWLSLVWRILLAFALIGIAIIVHWADREGLRDNIDGHVSFADANGKPVLSEVAGGRSFAPLKVEGKQYLSVRQRFQSPDDEGLYGFGQHQQGWMNQKGRNVELQQMADNWFGLRYVTVK